MEPQNQFLNTRSGDASRRVAFEDRGERALRGIEDAQRLYAVRAREIA